MVRFYAGEKWKEIKVPRAMNLRYAVSNYGRFMSFVDKFVNGRILKGGVIEGYQVYPYKVTSKKGIAHKTFFMHRLVAEYFLKKKSKDQVQVIHLDFDRGNNSIENLKWVTRPQMVEHNKKSPAVIKARKELIAHNIKSDGRKLTVAKARLIKERILNPNRKTPLSQIAKQFGISEMHIYRIKSGENWGHLKV